MAEYQHFAAIFTTTLIREEFKKVVVDPIKLEFFKGGARTIAIPPVTGRIFPCSSPQFKVPSKIVMKRVSRHEMG
jgi:hypothetical protein